MKFDLLLNKFDAVLKANNPIEYNKLQPSLSFEETNVLLKQIGINDADFIKFYGWKNGQPEDLYVEIMEYGAPLSLGEMLESKNDPLYSVFDPHLIPFISAGEEMLLFNTKPGPNYGKIYLYSVPQLFIEYPISYYDSLPDMVNTTMSAYKLNIYKYDDERQFLDYDLNLLSQLIQKMNPNSMFWKAKNKLDHSEWYEI